MDLSTITVADFKARFYRDFSYAQVNTDALPAVPDPEFVQDQDITTAFSDAMEAINQALFPDDTAIKTGYLLLSAHFLCQNIMNANGGASSSGAFPVSARSVGNVSESYSIPEAYLDNPILATYTSTGYGMQYLAKVLPATVGNVAAVYGGTNA